MARFAGENVTEGRGHAHAAGDRVDVWVDGAQQRWPEGSFA